MWIKQPTAEASTCLIAFSLVFMVRTSFSAGWYCKFRDKIRISFKNRALNKNENKPNQRIGERKGKRKKKLINHSLEN